MGPLTRTVGGVSILAVPLLMVLADELRMTAEGRWSAGIVDTEYGVDSVLSGLRAIEQNQGMFVLSASLSYAAVLLMIPALLAMWRLSVARSPRWAWTGATLAALGVAGSMVHITGYHGLTLGALEVSDRAGAAELIVEVATVPFVIALFTPFFLSLLAPLPQVVALLRAGVLPLRAAVSVVAGTVLFLVIGSTPWSVAIWGGLVIAGLAPAALAMLRGEPAVAEPAQPATPVRA